MSVSKDICGANMENMMIHLQLLRKRTRKILFQQLTRISFKYIDIYSLILFSACFLVLLLIRNQIYVYAYISSVFDCIYTHIIKNVFGINTITCRCEYCR